MKNMPPMEWYAISVIILFIAMFLCICGYIAYEKFKAWLNKKDDIMLVNKNDNTEIFWRN